MPESNKVLQTIEVEDDIYQHIAANTTRIGESASDILRRLLGLEAQVTAPATMGNAPVGRVFDLLNQGDVNAQKGAVGKFLYILAMLHRCHRDQFSLVLAIRGRDRQYFADSEATLQATGNSTNPKQIPQSNYWVITNTNTTKKKSMLTQVALALGYSSAEAEQIRDFL